MIGKKIADIRGLVADGQVSDIAYTGDPKDFPGRDRFTYLKVWIYIQAIMSANQNQTIFFVLIFRLF